MNLRSRTLLLESQGGVLVNRNFSWHRVRSPRPDMMSSRLLTARYSQD